MKAQSLQRFYQVFSGTMIEVKVLTQDGRMVHTLFTNNDKGNPFVESVETSVACMKYQDNEVDAMVVDSLMEGLVDYNNKYGTVADLIVEVRYKSASMDITYRYGM